MRFCTSGQNESKGANEDDMKLYEINEQLQNILNLAEEETIMDGYISDETANKLENLSFDFEEKADNIACLIKNNLAESKALKEEANNLFKRARSKDKSTEYLTNYLLTNMKISGKNQIETTRNKIKLRKNPESAEVDSQFLDWAIVNADHFLKYKEPLPDKTAIKEALKNGQAIPFARIVQNERIEIK